MAPKLPIANPSLPISIDIRSALSLVSRREARTIVRKKAVLGMRYFDVSNPYQRTCMRGGMYRIAHQRRKFSAACM